VKSKHVFSNLFVLKFPITAITSIIHRITGIFLFLCIPVFLYFFKIALASESSFLLAKNFLNFFYIKCLIFVFISAFMYHLIMGLKHIIMDLGYFDGKNSSSNFSLVALIFVVFLIFVSILI